MSGTVTKLRDEMRAASQAASALMKTADAEKRELTAEERTTLDGHLAEARKLKARLGAAEDNDKVQAEIQQLLDASQHPLVAPASSLIPAPAQGKSLGQQWAESAAMEYFRDARHRVGAWKSPTVTLYAATLTEDPASGGKLILPTYQPGIVGPLAEPIGRVADLFAQGTTDSANMSWLVEKTATNAAAPVLEGGDKPESALTFDQVTEAVRKVATWLPVSEEMLADVAQIRAYIDARLRLFVAQKMDQQVISGTGVAPELRGILATTGILPAVAVGAAEMAADAILRQALTIFNTSFLMPDAVVINPADWAGILLSRDGGGMYLAPGAPWNALPPSRLWGMQVVATAGMAQGTALVGAFAQGGQFWRRTGIDVQASNSHADFFIKNLVAIRAEQRALLTVYRPQAFGTVTGLSDGLATPTNGAARGAAAPVRK